MFDKFNTLFFPHDEKPSHIKALDGLRGIAVLIVLLAHTSNHGMYFHKYLRFEKSGQIGVYLFFVLSAYLLDRQIIMTLLANQSSILYWKNYALRRFLRIYPLFFLAVISYGAVTKFSPIYTAIDDIIDLPLHLLLLKEESIFWSIPVEIKYYLLSPLILLFCHKYLTWKRGSVFIFLSLTGLISIISLIFYEPSNIAIISFLPIFLSGTVISIYELLYKKKYDSFSKTKIELVGIIAIIIIFLSFTSIKDQLSNHYPQFYKDQNITFIYGLLWGIVLWSSKFGIGAIRKILESKLIRFLGSISFSVYLFHMLIIRIISHYSSLSALNIYFVFALTILISSITYLFIERPLSTVTLYSKSHSEKDYLPN